VTEETQFYDALKPKLLRDFEVMAEAADPVLATHFGDREAFTIVGEIRAEYERLIPQIPYIGGAQNRMTDNLIGTTASLAIYNVLRARGETVERIGRVHYEIIEAYLAAQPQWRFRVMRAFMATGLGVWVAKRMLRRAAARSQRRQYEDDFVLRFVEGDGEEFDYGIDVEECAVEKFFREQGAEDFTKYVCLYDFPQSELSGTGLVRTGTIAEGCARCDFRFKGGRQPENLGETTAEGPAEPPSPEPPPDDG
jgi:hypothetical protein